MLEASARLGSDQSAHTLAVHYSALDDEASSRKWLRVAARRGNCPAIRLLLYDAASTKDQREQQAELEAEARRRSCDYDAALVGQLRAKAQDDGDR